MRKILYLLFVALILALIAGCANPPIPIAKDTVVTFNYPGKTNDGTTFDTTTGKEPFTVLFGEGNMIPGLEKSMMGLKPGDKKTITILAADAYGPHRDEMVLDVPKSTFPKDMKLTEGEQLVSQTPQGPMPLKIVKIDTDTVKVDLNHPLAGKDLTFDVQVITVRKATADEISGKTPITQQQPKTQAAPSSAK